ncbi:MAG: glycosyltransferase family 4 protein [Rhodospirillales bacterium]|nr:glycosyltransferase family 4 protein [Rhodospirillales bacterium]
MRIAQIAPLIECVPPKLYGGTERVVSWLTEELVRLGHEVTLFASGDSETTAELVAVSDRALRLDPSVKDVLPYNVLLLEAIRKRASDFDILHFHVDFMYFPLFRHMADRTLSTLHGRLDLPDLQPLFREFPDMPLVSISNNQRLPLPPVNWQATIYHGQPADLLTYEENPSCDYFAFLGRISPEKRPDRAINIAARTGMPLRMASKIDKVDQKYFDESIQPLIDANHDLVSFTGEFENDAKQIFLGNAKAVIFPIDWPEPFGLVMIEAMACGVPVIAYRCGSVPEVIDDGLTGFIVDNDDEAVAALNRVESLDRRKIRARFEERFTDKRMTADYVKLYETMLAKARKVRAA